MAEADAPPSIVGKYSTVTQGGDEASDVTIAKGSAAGFFEYASVDKDGLVIGKRQIRFDRISGDWYLIQSQTVDTAGILGEPYYRFLKTGRGKLEEYEASCDSAVASIPNVHVNDGDCSFADYKALKAAAAARLAQPDGLTLQNSYTKK
ncbi:hypothetical protein SZ64_05440 [Erythrobacter sp. SG61-1L]|nr:hypothetical protein SZ64_05440 [Erythrobacter sp. SG61-1L]